MIRTRIWAGLIRLVFGLVELVLGFRFILTLFGANPNASFVIWVNQFSQPLLQPFGGIFAPITINHNFIFDTITLFALVSYGILGEVIIAVIYFVYQGLRALIDKRRLSPAERQYTKNSK